MFIAFFFLNSFVHVQYIVFYKSKQPVILSFCYKYAAGFFCDSSKAPPHVVTNAIRMDSHFLKDPN